MRGTAMTPCSGLAAVVSAAAALVVVAGCSTATTTAPTPTGPTASHSTASGSSSAANPLAGTWQTAALPWATWEASFRRAGATPAEAVQFSKGHGTVDRIILRLSGTDWALFDQWDDQTPNLDSTATYTLSGNRVDVTDADNPEHCQQVFAMTLSSNTLRLRLVSNGTAGASCGRDSLLHGRTLFGTAPFQRVS
jgi:hypothetical protein